MFSGLECALIPGPKAVAVVEAPVISRDILAPEEPSPVRSRQFKVWTLLSFCSSFFPHLTNFHKF